MVENIDELIYSAIFSPDETAKKSSRASIRKLAEEKGIKLLLSMIFICRSVKEK